MRTFRKALCLVMAMLFVLGLCTIGAGAAYTDDAKINYTDAVTVMTGLGIIQGYPDGSFQPTKNVTRAEAAKMITYMMLGAANAEKIPAGTGNFSDVTADKWYAKYVNFCASNGYIKGMGDGTFAPEANVTGVQLATMLLRACGYGVMGEYEGKGWDVNAVTDALTEGIFEDSEVEDFAQPATREECALYVFNTLVSVDKVGYDVDLNYYKDMGETYGEKIWDLEQTGPVQIVANQATGADYTVIADGVAILSSSGKTINTIANFKLDTDVDLIAHKVNIYYRAVEKTDADGNDYFVAYLADDLSKVVNGFSTKGAMYKALKAAGANVKTVDITDAYIWENYANTEKKYNPGEDNINFADYKDINVEYTPFASGSKLILDEKGEFLAYMTTKYTVAKVKLVDKEEDEIVLSGTDVKGSFTVSNAYEGIKKNDLVTVIPVGDIYKIEPTTTVEVEITEANSKRLTYNNGKYSCNTNMFGAWQYIDGEQQGLLTSKEAVDAAKVEAGWTVRFYLDSKGKVFAIEGVKVRNLAGSVLLVNAWTKEVDGKTSEQGVYVSGDTYYYVTVINEAGETVVYETEEAFAQTTGKDPKFDTSKMGVYNVYINSDDYAELEAVDDELGAFSGKTTYLKSDDSGKTYVVNDDTAIYNVKKSSAKGTFSAKAISKLQSGVAAYATVTASGALQTVWYYNATIKDETVESSYVYIKASMGKVSNAGFKWIDADGDGEEEECAYWTIYVDGQETKSVVLKNGDNSKTPLYTADSAPAEGFYTYTEKNGIYTIKKYTDSKKVFVNEALGEEDVLSGRWFHNDADGISVSSLKVVNLSLGTDGKDYLVINSVDDIEDLYAEYDNVTLKVSYIAKSVTGKGYVPTGVLYVTSASASNDEE